MKPDSDRMVISGNRSRPVADVLDRAACAASGLKALGVGVGDSVAILMRNAIEFAEANRAAVLLGAYAVPLNWHLAPGEVAYVLNDCDARVVISHADLLHLIPTEKLAEGLHVIVVDRPLELAAAYPKATPGAIPPGAAAWESFIAAHPPLDNPGRPRDSMIYTSGTTGKPKGVRRLPPDDAQRAQLNRMREEIYFLTPGIRQILPAPLYHGAPNIFANRALEIADATVIMPRFDPEEFLRLIERHRITNAVMVPTMFVRLLRLSEETRRAYDLSSLKVVLHAAAPCPTEIKARMIGWLGPIVHEWYGATETSAVTFCTAAEWLARPGTVGRAIEGGRVEIRGEDGSLLPPGEEGDIYMGLDFMPDFTYHKRDTDRAAIGRNGLVTAGDIGVLDEDGYLFIRDRRNDMVISGGVNIYPAEIEAALLEMDAIADCTVIGVPDAEFGEALLALVVPRETLTEDAVRHHLTPLIAGYKVPRRIEFRDSLPRDDMGKILKRRLRETFR